MKRVVCVFAHPDDEAFGPGGTIALLARDYEVYIVCATKGEAGQNSLDEADTLGHIRSAELEASAHILGVKKVFFLGYKDGTLSNNLYHEIAEKVATIIDELVPEIVLTYEYRGVSGHIDHITMSLVTNFIFAHNPSIKKLMMHAVLEDVAALRHDYFIYFPPGYKEADIDEVVDTTEVWDTKVKAMHCHASQKHDITNILSVYENRPKKEYFLVRTQEKQ